MGFISSFPDIDDLVQVALEERVAAINHSFADPTPYVAPAHASGVRVFAQVQRVAQAKRAAQAGADVIIAQGTEAGAHTGLAGTLALVPAVAVRVLAPTGLPLPPGFDLVESMEVVEKAVAVVPPSASPSSASP